MQDLVWTGNLQLVDVNSLDVDLYPGSVKSRQYLQTPQLRLSMLLLQVVVDSIRSDLRLDDAEGTACLLNEAIFEGLARMGKEEDVSNDESEDEDHVPTPSSDPLPSAKDAQAKEIDALKKQVTKLTKWRKLRSRGLGRLKRICSGRRVKYPMEKDEEVVMKTTTGVKDSAAPTTNVTKDEITMAQALAALKSVKTNVVVQEQEMSTTIPAAATKVTTDVPTLRGKGKAKMIEPEVPLKKKDQMRIDEEYFRKLQAKEQEAARLSRAQEDEEANNS
nr:hypothetical protein [Tanacetum cinerariifolium]